MADAIDTSTAEQPLAPDELRLIYACWRAANYLSVGQIYLLDNPLLREPLQRRARQAATARPLRHHARPQPDVRPPEPGDPRTRPRRHLRHRSRSRRARRSSRTPSSKGTYSELYPDVGATRRGCARCSDSSRSPAASRATRRRRRPARSMKAASSATRSSTRSARPSTIRSLSSPAWSATARPRPARWPRAGTRTSSSNPAHDGAVLPILHLNGYKIANPTVLARIPEAELVALFEGYGWEPLLVRAASTARIRRRCTSASPPRSTRRSTGSPRSSAARGDGELTRPRWPMIVLRSPKGCDRPKEVDGKPVEGTGVRTRCRCRRADNPAHLRQLEEWLRSYRPEELFDEDGRLVPELAGSPRPATGG